MVVVGADVAGFFDDDLGGDGLLFLELFVCYGEAAI